MNPYVMPCVCDVCGEKGVCRPRDSGAQWMGGSLRHTDPAVCAENLRWRREQEEREKYQGEPCPSI